MKQSLADTGTDTALVVSDPPPNPPAIQERRALGPHEGLDGEFDMGDIEVPRLNLVGKTSKLVSKTTPAGVFLYNKSVQVGDGETPFRLAVLSISKEYWQKLPEGSSERPMVFKTIREVREAGGSTDYGTTDLPFQKAGRTFVLIESDTESPGFSFESSGKFYAPASWFLSGTAFTAAAMKFITDMATRKPGTNPCFYEVTSKIETNSKGSWYLPVVRITRDEVPEELLQQVRAVFA